MTPKPIPREDYDLAEVYHDYVTVVNILRKKAMLQHAKDEENYTQFLAARERLEHLAGEAGYDLFTSQMV